MKNHIRFTTILTVSLLIVSFASFSLAEELSQPIYDVIEEKNVMVTMRDGVRLATDIYLPTEKGEVVGEKLSTILRRTPYNKETAHKVAMYYATRGYAVVFQDTRGRYKSEGV